MEKVILNLGLIGVFLIGWYGRAGITLLLRQSKAPRYATLRSPAGVHPALDNSGIRDSLYVDRTAAGRDYDDHPDHNVRSAYNRGYDFAKSKYAANYGAADAEHHDAKQLYGDSCPSDGNYNHYYTYNFWLR